MVGLWWTYGGLIYEYLTFIIMTTRSLFMPQKPMLKTLRTT